MLSLVNLVNANSDVKTRWGYADMRLFYYLCKVIKLLSDMAKAKPFIKWVGGKTQLIDQLEALLPADFDSWRNATYIELSNGFGFI